MNRLLLAAACSALLLACPPPSKPDGGGGGGGGGFWFGGGTGGTGGAGGSGGGTGSVLADCQAFVGDYCQFLQSCGYVTDGPTCLAALGTICPGLDLSVSKGYTRYDPTELGQCRAQIAAATATCNFSGVSCNPWTGLMGDGGACETVSDCAGSNVTCGDSTGACPTTCVPRGSLGMTCYGGGCAAPLHCSNTTQQCTNPIAAGQPCNSAEYLACGDSAACTGGVCVSYPGNGQVCTFNCQAGLFCKAEATGRFCRPKPTQGQACTGSECVAGLHCVTNTCQPLSTQGGPCTATSDCAAGLACFGTCQPPHAVGGGCTRYDQCDNSNCDTALGTCTSYSDQRDAGQPCGTAAHCLAGLVCRGLSVADGGYAPGTCGQGAVGDPCARAYSSYDCAPGMRCQGADGGLGLGQGACQVPGVRSPCQRDTDCLPEHFCQVGAPSLCEPRAAVGAACTATGAPCVAGAACGSVAGALQCVVQGKPNQPCAATATSAAQCVSGLYCVQGTCRGAGFPGGVCAASGGSFSCLIGRCDADGGIDAGPGVLIGRCVSPSPAGSPCRVDNDCATQRCRNGVCGALCP